MPRGNPSRVKLTISTSSGSSGLRSLNLQVFVTIAAIVAIMLFSTWTIDGACLGARNVSSLLYQTAITGILAVGVVFTIASAGTDLSVGPMMGLLGGVMATCDVWLGRPLPLTTIVMLVLGLLPGAWNGWWVAYRKILSFIVTLVGMLAFRGIFISITNDTTISSISAAMSQTGQSYLPANTDFIIGAFGLMAFVGRQWRGRMHHQALGLQPPAFTAAVGRQALVAIIVLGAVWLLDDYRGAPAPVLPLTLLLLGGTFMAMWTVFGRRTHAIGGNLEVVCLSGINVERTKLAVFVINGLMVTIARLVFNSRFGAGLSPARNIAELDTIVACVTGGTSLAGGVESVVGAIMGAFIMASLDNGTSMMDAPIFWQYIAKGAILLLAIWMDPVTKRRSRFW